MRKNLIFERKNGNWKEIKEKNRFKEEDYKDAFLKIDAEQKAGISLSLADIQNTLIEKRKKRIDKDGL